MDTNVRLLGCLEQVVINLVINARDAMPDGGSIAIRTYDVSVDPASESLLDLDLAPGDYVVLAVSDDGHGMDVETQNRIFEPFFTTKEVNRGTGLGLSTCYGIIQQADGQIRVDSALGKGTTFEIYLPQRHPPSHEPSAEVDGRRDRRDTSGTETILVVEDDPQVRRLTQRILRRLGYDLIVGESGEDGLHKAASAGRTIHLLLTDVIMPGMGGRALADDLLARHPRMRVIFMSGYTANAMQQQGTIADYDILIQKPFSPDDLSQLVREVLDEAQLEQCVEPKTRSDER